MAALQQLIKHPKHIEAKEKQGKWLEGYQVIIVQIVRAYGDKVFDHPVKTFVNS